jgi:very-short-patch-repair endonuclease
VVRSSSPIELRRYPFMVADARRAGLRWDDLQTRVWTRMSRGQYAWNGLTQDPRLKLQAVARRVPPRYAFSGLTAAWILGLDAAWCEPIEVTIGREVPVRARAGVKLRRAALPESDVIVRGGLRLTSAMRTVRDLGGRADVVESVVAVDVALRVGLVQMSDLLSHVATHPGEKGIRRLRRALRLADPRSESQMETRLRLELIMARLPRPSVQSELCDAMGNFIGRADLYYPDRRLVIEYDGENHKERLVADLRRQNALVNAGYHLLRFTAADLRSPGSVVAQVRRARAMLPSLQVRPDEAA